jgi:hypothetical protein
LVGQLVAGRNRVAKRFQAASEWVGDFDPAIDIGAPEKEVLVGLNLKTRYAASSNWVEARNRGKYVGRTLTLERLLQFRVTGEMGDRGYL